MTDPNPPGKTAPDAAGTPDVDAPDAAAPAGNRPAADISPQELAADLREVLRPLWRRFNAHRTLSLSKVGILSHLEVHGPLTATELAGLERISHQAVASAVRELQSLELVTRSSDPGDGRRTLLHLTGPGRQRLQSERVAGQDWLARSIDDHLDATERATLAEAVPLLRRLDSDGHSGVPGEHMPEARG